MFCENCGTELLNNSVFCQECGHKVIPLENETQNNKDNFSIEKDPNLFDSRGPVPPVMRQSLPRQPSQPYEKEMANRQLFEPYGKKTSLGQKPEPIRKEPTLRNNAASDRWESKINQEADIIGFGQYVLMIFLAGIPILNIILFIKWGFFLKQNPNRSNFAKAMLFYYIIAVIIYVAFIRLWLKTTSGI